MSARDDILGRIRAALGSERAPLAAQSPAPDARGALDSNAASFSASAAARDPVISLGGVDLVARFVAKVQQVSATCAHVATAADAPAAVDAYLRDAGLADAPLVVAAALDALPWRAHCALPGVDLRRDGLVSVTPSFAAIAETGSVVCLSSSATPTSLNFVAATHVVLVKRSAIVATMEDAWARVRATVATLPRAVNVITGPSRTADVEQTVQVGVHGPKRVLVLICDDA
ncbi:LUD domain-containing protein [Burkholderia sp. MSMB1589WGS]|uniref:LutC/YkgG family protein n=1 Tax=Burkholderia sp. MSMB1589WGS TaxID=1636425 RepID=UPI0007B7A823|nr:LUD domain-containing protein [Burkholderia sp. MSMB1589WGS]